MDESVRLFQEEQERLAQVGGSRGAIEQIGRQLLLQSAGFIVLLTVLGLILVRLPRDPGHLMNVLYYGPVLLAFAALAGMFLRARRFRESAMRPACWTFIFFAALAILAGIVDAIRLGHI